MPVTSDSSGEAGAAPPSAGVWYADRFRVGQNAFEFKIDCGHESPEEELMTVYLRIIANPANAQQLFRLLGVALLRYCDAYGLIDGDEGGER
jgi:hypothetical protein